MDIKQLSLGLTTPFWGLLLMGASCNPSFTSGFESGFSGWTTDTCCQHSLKTVSSPRLEGNRAAQFTLSKNDPDVAGSKRAEIGLNYVPANSEWTYRFSNFLPSTYATDPSYEILVQFHPLPDFDIGETWHGGPSMALTTVNGNWVLNTIWDAKPFTVPGKPEGRLSRNLGAYQKGRWNDWIFHIKWSYGSNGLTEVWRNGQLVFRRIGPNTFNDKRGPYLKIGMYKPDWKSAPYRSTTTQRIIYYDRFSQAKCS